MQSCCFEVPNVKKYMHAKENIVSVTQGQVGGMVQVADFVCKQLFFVMQNQKL